MFSFLTEKPVNFVIPAYLNSLSWLKSGLFWRTFVMLAFLVTTSMAVWFLSLRLLERTPTALRLAGQVNSIVNLTRTAMQHAEPEQRKLLLSELAQNDGIRIYPRHKLDQIEPIDEKAISSELQRMIALRLGANTLLSKSVNHRTGLWVGFTVNNDAYWLQLDEDQLDPPYTISLLGWASFALILTLLAAAILTQFINEPLARLSEAAQLLAVGKTPPPLPLHGPAEISETNASFNGMVADLARSDADRNIILAGISHDLRTPLARMQLEVEMAGLSESARLGMQADLEQMDAIINQFLDFSKPVDALPLTRIDIAELLRQLIQDYTRHEYLHIRSALAPRLYVQGNETELRRIFSNLIENACRYGKNPGQTMTMLEIQCSKKNKGRKQGIQVSFRDHGRGAPSSDLSHLLRPFTRADIARSQANGSGLGLAIVDRIVKRHRGRLHIYNHDERGFVAVMLFPEMKA